jgi:ATP-dependent Clp protease ATP-binding subunit ClpB
LLGQRLVSNSFLKTCLFYLIPNHIGFFAADEYRKTIGKDAALERRFQPVTIDEPTVASTISILRGLKSKYEVHHGVEISDGALVTG